MARLDSGNETLVSDESPCDLTETPPNANDLESTTRTQSNNKISSNNNNSNRDESLIPPKITPFSGVLDKGKIVVRPIAFKPIGLMTNSRFNNGSERYGSTPVLTRPGSQLTLYGSSTDLRHHHQYNGFNYSLDRKSLSSASSPPLGMTLSSLPQKLHTYDSMENVRHCQSPGSTSSRNNSHCSFSAKTKSSSFRMISNADSSSSLLDLTPSPSDSGVAELEAALRERDSELVYLRQTMEHNEQAIIRVYQEKERAWERDRRRLKAVHENRLRTSAQKTLKLEQLLMMQTYQLQQEKKRLREEADRAARETTDLRQEVDLLRGRLEETEWGLCQKTGEMSLLKAQLKNSQGDQTSKGHELVQLRNQIRDLKAELEKRESDFSLLVKKTQTQEKEVESVKKENERLRLQLERSERKRQTETEALNDQVVTLKRDLDDVCQVLKEKENDEMRVTIELEKLRQQLQMEKRAKDSGGEPKAAAAAAVEEEGLGQADRLKGNSEETVGDKKSATPIEDIKQLYSEVHCLKNQLLSERTDFEQERITWAQEKEKVLRYQRQLQLNYVQMFRRTRTLEAEVESLTMELELEANTKGFRNSKKVPISTEMGPIVEL